MSSTEIKVLQHAAKNGFNVRLIGKHGVGKTAMVKQVFEEMGWVWRYFSASTIDPWTDLVGVPKEVNGVLDIIRPASIDFDNLEAIFLDEYNRAPKKVRNACMELIQFGSINGKKFPKLKVVWIAVNPDDDEELSYDVEKLDPAQIDRFQIHITVPNEPCPYYFKRVFGHVGSLAVKWWKAQTAEIKGLVSPRRLEAAIKVYQAGGDVQYVMDPQKVNHGQFTQYLEKPDPIELLEDIITKSNEERKKFLSDRNNLEHVRNDLMGKERYLKELAHLLPDEEIMRELRDQRGNRVSGFVINNISAFQHLLKPVLDNYRNYSGRVVDAFRVYRDTNGKSNNPALTGRVISINGKKVAVSEMAICFTGTLNGYSRQQAQDLMRQYGAQITENVTLSTTHLVKGDKTGRTKLTQATQRNIEILTENDFLKIVQELDSPTLVN